jgi:uncharacterized protein (DUF983 family)
VSSDDASAPGGQTGPRTEVPPIVRPPAGTLIRRALNLHCPACGEGPLFVGWFTMPPHCPQCELKYERGPGYFLGSAYINYGLTAGLMMVAYFVLHFGFEWSNRQLAAPLLAFCTLFPLWTFRYARALWLALDCHFDKSVLRDPRALDGDVE